jgi:hypothetical protein
VDAVVVLRQRVGSRRDGPTKGLKKDRDDVAADEYDRNNARLKGTKVVAVDKDNSRQAKINRHGKKSWSERGSDDISRKYLLAENVVMELYAGDVANNFQSQPAKHSEHISPCHISNA